LEPSSIFSNARIAKAQSMLSNSTLPNVVSHGPSGRKSATLHPPVKLLALDRRDRGKNDKTTDHLGDRLHHKPIQGVSNGSVEVCPPDIVKRLSVTSGGMTAEVIQATKNERVETRFCAPVLLLVAYERGTRDDGDTFVEGLPGSRLRDFGQKLTFVPAGHQYYDWQQPRSLNRVSYFYIDPAQQSVDPDLGLSGISFAPRLFFENTPLWDTARKLTMLIESGDVSNRLYFEALGVVLVHELVRLNVGTQSIKRPVRGGLTTWQKRTILDYIEENLAEQISLETLAKLVRLSPYYFCRAFKRSVGMPPHQYHTLRRIERAKPLLAQTARSVTDVGFAVGFNQTSSFTAAFHRITGHTPTAYQRSFG
jgi:AraC family transcriptional regulator